jgi:hypothetical protein
MEAAKRDGKPFLHPLTNLKPNVMVIAFDDELKEEIEAFVDACLNDEPFFHCATFCT